MNKEISKAAAILGRKGGQVKSPAKSTAAKDRKKHNITDEARAKGLAKLASLTPEQRRKNAKKAAEARWAKWRQERGLE